MYLLDPADDVTDPGRDRLAGAFRLVAEQAGAPAAPAATASSRSSRSRSVRARAARSGSFQLSASAISLARSATRARICQARGRVEYLVRAEAQVGPPGLTGAWGRDQVGGGDLAAR